MGLIRAHRLIQRGAEGIHALGKGGEVLHCRIQVSAAVVQQGANLFQAGLEIRKSGIQAGHGALALLCESLIGPQGPIQVLQGFGDGRVVQHHPRAALMELSSQFVDRTIEVAQQFVRFGEDGVEASAGISNQHRARLEFRDPLIHGRQDDGQGRSAEPLPYDGNLGAFP